MAYRVAESVLNASTYDIVNVIRLNSSLEYQNTIPEVKKPSDLPRVGELLMGHPSLANQFINALVNRIALVNVKSALFNNAYAMLKKGYLEYGETVEEVFVGIAKAREFSVEKAAKREFQRTLPDVRSAFHTINWRVQYPITIQEDDLQQAFLSEQGVQDLIAKIVDSVYTGAEYDEFLLFKYLMIKGIAKGQLKPVPIESNGDIKLSAEVFRGTSNLLTFMSKEYNYSRVTTTTPRDDQYIFMDSKFNAKYDVEVLAGAFNMDKADFIGRLHLIDDWTTFDNERFDVIRENSDMIESVTPEELELMKGVKAVLVDKEWFQIYDNKFKFTETYVSSGLYWNYTLHVWKTVSSSPFSNAVVFADNSIETVGVNIKLTQKMIGEDSTIYVVEPEFVGNESDESGLSSHTIEFIQTPEATANGVGVQKYGVYMIPNTVNLTTLEDGGIPVVFKVDGKTYNMPASDRPIIGGNVVNVGDTCDTMFQG